MKFWTIYSNPIYFFIFLVFKKVFVYNLILTLNEGIQKYILMKFSETFYGSALCFAIECDNYEAVKLLLQNQKIDVTINLILDD